MYAHTLPGPEKLCECFYADDIQLQIQVGPPGKQPPVDCPRGVPRTSGGTRIFLWGHQGVKMRF